MGFSLMAAPPSAYPVEHDLLHVGLGRVGLVGQGHVGDEVGVGVGLGDGLRDGVAVEQTIAQHRELHRLQQQHLGLVGAEGCRSAHERGERLHRASHARSDLSQRRTIGVSLSEEGEGDMLRLLPDLQHRLALLGQRDEDGEGLTLLGGTGGGEGRPRLRQRHVGAAECGLATADVGLGLGRVLGSADRLDRVLQVGAVLDGERPVGERVGLLALLGGVVLHLARSTPTPGGLDGLSHRVHELGLEPGAGGLDRQYRA
jgi:hypothetical protein